MCTRDGQKRQQQQQCNRLQTLFYQEYLYKDHCKLGEACLFPQSDQAGMDALLWL